MPRNSRRLSARYAAQAQHDASLAEYYANRAEEHADMAEYYGQVDWSKVGASIGKFASRARKSATKLGAQAREAAMAMRDSYQQKMAARAGASYYGNRALSADEMGPLTGARVHAMANLNRASGGRIHYYDGDRALSAEEMGALTGSRVHAMANLKRASGGRIHYYDGNACKMIAGSMRDDATGMPCSESQ